MADPTVLERLRLFQIRRLETEYQDFVSHPTHGALGRFFIHDIYGVQDGQRDKSVVDLYKRFENRLPADVIAWLRKLLRLHQLTHGFDDHVARLLIERSQADPIEMGPYETAYRDAGDYAGRKEQIDLSVEAIERVHKLSGNPKLEPLLKALGWVADTFGAGPLVTYVRRGYEAFRGVQQIEPFANAIRDRELIRLDRIFEVGEVLATGVTPEA